MRPVTGQLEITMTKTFCAAGQIKMFVRSPGCPPILQEAATILTECYDTGHKGTLMADIRSMTGDGPRPATPAVSSPCELDLAVKDALKSAMMTHPEQFPPWLLSAETSHHNRLIVEGLQYSVSHATRRDSMVYFLPSGGTHPVPGMIRDIFSMPDPSHADTYHRYLAIHPLKTASPTEANPFLLFPDFGAEIWSKGLDDVKVVALSCVVAHAEWRDWGTCSYVIKTLYKVSRHQLN